MPRPPMSQEEYIKKANSLHSNKYMYSKTKYVNMKTKITVTCPDHGDFYVLASNHVKVLKRRDVAHLSPCGCPTCGREQVISRNLRGRKSLEVFVAEASEVHGGKYTYDNTVYTTNYNNVEIGCPRHGPFFQQPTNHLRGTGCPRCKNSKGQTRVSKILTKMGINFITEHTFDDCRGDTSPLKFDFYIPRLNVLIEYDGEQHFNPVKFHANITDERAVELLHQTQKYDKIKNEYVTQHNIPLLRISYLDLPNAESMIRSYVSHSTLV